LTQAEIVVETGAAIAAVLASRLKPNTPRYLAKNIQTSGAAAIMRSDCVKQGNRKPGAKGETWGCLRRRIRLRE
jgi:hypothetical protein